jgi:uncharacterized UPF0160 family protein
MVIGESMNVNLILFLAYCYYISVVIGMDPDGDRDSLEEVYDQVYANFVEEVDASDNKVSSLIGATKCVCVCV